MWQKIKDFIFRRKTVDDYLKYPEGKRIYKEFHNLKNNAMDTDGLKIIARLTKNGYKAYFVGGCIRDLLLNRKPKDFDVVTNATPNDVKKLFVNSRIIGKRFKIVHIYFKNKKRPSELKIIETSTFRKLPEHRLNGKINGESLILKRDNVYGTAKEDAARRDFTINSLYYDPRNETIIDYTGGFEDLKNKKIKTIGSPYISFKEDPVRMIRSIKFECLLNFTIEKKVIRSIKRNKEEILKVNKSRLLEEFYKIFKTGVTYQIFKSFYKYELLNILFPNVIQTTIFFYNFYHKTNKKIPFEETPLAKRLKIADEMLAVREELSFNIYMSLIICDFVYRVFHPKWNQGYLTIDDYIKDQLSNIFKHLQIPGKDQERISQIFIAQRQIGKVSLDPEKRNLNQNQKIIEYKEKKYFFEAFMVYKIFALGIEDDDLIQKARVWEIGPRTKPPDDIKLISLFPKTTKTNIS